MTTQTLLRCGARCFIVMAGMFALVGMQTATANPNSAEPDKGLAAHGTIPEAKDLATKLYALYATHETNLLKWSGETYVNAPEKLPQKLIGKAFAENWQGLRDARRLQRMGEPAGTDLERRFGMMTAPMKRIALRSNANQGGRYKMSLKKQLDREQPRRQKFLQQAGAALDSGKTDRFLPLMENHGIELYAKIAFFTPTEATKYSGAFDSLMSRGESLIHPKERIKYAEQAKSAMQAHANAANAFPTEAKRIVDEIATTGKASLGDAGEVGPAKAFAHLVDLWGRASSGLTRMGTIEWVFAAGISSSPSATSISPESRARSRKLSDEARQWLSKLIEATAQATPADQVSTVYADLLKEVSIAERRSQTSVREACQSALEKLAAKAPDLPGAIKDYEAATAEVLRWRKEFATQQGRALQKAFPLPQSHLTKEEVIKDSNKPAIFGSVSRRPRPLGRSNLTPPVNWAIYEASPFILNQRIASERVVRLSRTSRTAVVPFTGYHYLNVALPMPSEPQITDLKAALLIDESHPPLSFAAADAISSAELHDYQQVGGVVNKLHLESATTRFIAFPDAAYPLVPLGNLPLFEEGIAPLNQACWRFDVTPNWAQHQYFVVFAPKN